MQGYAPMFHEMQVRNTMDEDLPVVLGWYAEDVTRILETEVYITATTICRTTTVKKI